MTIYRLDPQKLLLALEMLVSLSQAGQTKELPDARQERTPGELRSFDEGFTLAICVLHRLGLEEEAEVLFAYAQGTLGVEISAAVIQAYGEASL